MSEATATAEAVEPASTAPEEAAKPLTDQEEYNAFKAGKSGAQEPAEPKAEEPAPSEPQAPSEPEKPAAEAPKPWKNPIPPERVQRMVQAREARIQELETELQKYRPAPAATPAAETEQAPDPNDAKYYRPDGSFDGAKYLKDNNEWVSKDAIRQFEARQAAERTKAEEQAAQAREAEELTTARASFTQQLEAHKAADPELGEKVAWFAENYAHQVPDRVARELLSSDPRVIGILAQNEELRNQAVHGDIFQTIKMIGVIEDRLSAVSPSAAPAPAQAPKQDLPRAPNGQFQPRQTPPAPMELPTRGGSSNSGLFSDDYRTFKKARASLR